MGFFYQKLAKPLFFTLNAEQAHRVVFGSTGVLQHVPGFKSLSSALFSGTSKETAAQVAGLSFPNRVGTAAGFDKNGKLTELLFSAGFGFVEVGSITARPSPGNPKPRLFRLPKDQALINRLGLNNDGAEIICMRLERVSKTGILGVNIAKTHDPAILGDAAVFDYLFSFKHAKRVADYITINVSCPNTTEGKTFEDPAALDELLAAISAENKQSGKPVFVKFSADLSRPDIEKLAQIALDRGASGFVAVNTSTSRQGLKTSAERILEIGRGGLSGKPVAEKSVFVIQTLRSFCGPDIPILGAGGIDSREEAEKRFRAGADLVQVYTGLIYRGPGLIRELARTPFPRPIV